MKYFILLSVIAYASSNPLIAGVVSSQYHAQDALGQYSYGYSGGPSSKQEIKTADGITRGAYSYIDGNGLVQSASYVADPVNGFRVAATNLPVGPAPAPIVASPLIASPLIASPLIAQPAARLLTISPLIAAGAAPLNLDGTVADTPEVAAAKAAHLAAVHEARSRGKRSAPLNPDGTVADTPEVAAAKLAHLVEVSKARGIPLVYAPRWWGPGAPLNADGTVADTPEVATAKAAHYAAIAQARNAPYWPWAGAAPLNADGTVADTPEVSAAKAVHFAAHAQARSLLPLLPVGPIPDTPEVHLAKLAHLAAHQEALSRSRRSAPLNPDGTVADTPEVALAKANHYAEVARARGLTLAGPVVGPAVYAAPEPRWWGPPAPLNPDGTVAETPEVRAAKGVHFAAYAAAARGLPVHPIVASVSTPWAPLNADGTVRDTPEVIARTIEHFAAHGDALQRIG